MQFHRALPYAALNVHSGLLRRDHKYPSPISSFQGSRSFLIHAGRPFAHFLFYPCPKWAARICHGKKLSSSPCSRTGGQGSPLSISQRTRGKLRRPSPQASTSLPTDCSSIQVLCSLKRQESSRLARVRREGGPVDGRYWDIFRILNKSWMSLIQAFTLGTRLLPRRYGWEIERHLGRCGARPPPTRFDPA